MGQTQQKPRRDEATQRGGGQKERREPHVLEWVVGGVSALLVLAMMGFILYRALTAASEEPDLHVVAQEIGPADEGFRVGFVAFNRGSGTAAGVTVEGRIEDGGATIETHRVTIDYVPAQSERHGGLFFSHDPRRYRLRIEATGYADP